MDTVETAGAMKVTVDTETIEATDAIEVTEAVEATVAIDIAEAQSKPQIRLMSKKLRLLRQLIPLRPSLLFCSAQFYAPNPYIPIHLLALLLFYSLKSNKDVTIIDENLTCSINRT